MGGCLPIPLSLVANVLARDNMLGREKSWSGRVKAFLPCRMDAERKGRLAVEGLALPRGFSFSGGGVGGKTFLPMTGGAL